MSQSPDWVPIDTLAADTAAEALGAKLGVKVVIDSDTEGVTGLGWPRRGRNGGRSTQIMDF
jgi:hypothetical protein